MAKTNHLTRESDTIWATALREARNGVYRPGRANERAIAWAQWKLERLGVPLPPAFMTKLVEGNSVVFTAHVDVEVAGSRVALGRGAFARSTRREIQEIATVALPAWCRPVKDAEAWLAANLSEV